MNWKKTMASTALSAALFMSVSVSAFAHDGWSQTKSPIIAPGEVSYVELLLGNHSNGHKSYRIAGQWSPDSSFLLGIGAGRLHHNGRRRQHVQECRIGEPDVAQRQIVRGRQRYPDRGAGTSLARVLPTCQYRSGGDSPVV
ncbi:MAG: hypothetical protein K0Q94_6074 [Paenibacillus sp.]|nr:hypothetical protein [Paenibacillus sp.]